MSNVQETKYDLGQLSDEEGAWQQVLKERQLLRRVSDFELGTIEFKAVVVDGQARLSLDVLQDNSRELQGLLPDGEYRWALSLSSAAAKKEN